MMPNTVSAVPDGAKDAVNISGVCHLTIQVQAQCVHRGYRSDYCNRTIHQIIER